MTIGTNFSRLALAVAALAIGGIGTAASAQSSVQGDYFVRPFVQYGNGVIDGYQQNGDTSASVNFANIVSSEVDLAEGVTRTYVNVFGPDAGGSGTGVAAGVFGDRVTFFGGASTPVTFSFAFDGTIDATARTSEDSMPIGVFANLFVFEAGSGATYENFTIQAGALVAKTLSLDFSSPGQDISVSVAELLSGSFTPTSGQSYDIFSSLSIYAATNANVSTVTMDFTHTGRFGIDTAPVVTFASASGVLLTEGGAMAAAVPEPASWAMLVVGFGLVGGALRRTRTAGLVAARLNPIVAGHIG